VGSRLLTRQRGRELRTIRSSSSSGAKGSKVVATLFVLAFWAKDLKGEKEAWEGMTEKARAFVAGAVEGVEVDELMRIVAGLI
jgi:hypothetical protein